MIDVMFETTSGDELGPRDLRGASWRVVETFVDVDDNDVPVFTVRVEPHSVDDLVVAALDE